MTHAVHPTSLKPGDYITTPDNRPLRVLFTKQTSLGLIECYAHDPNTKRPFPVLTYHPLDLVYLTPAHLITH